MDIIPTIGTAKTKIKKKRSSGSSIVPGGAIIKASKKQKNKGSRGGTSISIGASVAVADDINIDENDENNDSNNAGKDDKSKGKKAKQKGKGKSLARIGVGIQLERSLTPASTAIAITTETNALNSIRHPWELDPKWNIEAPKEGTKTMSDYCTKYKPPPMEKDENGTSTTSTILKTRRLRAEERKKQQEERGKLGIGHGDNNDDTNDINSSGPQVQVINGEIVIEESSLLLHQHKTIEQLDAELGGTAVVEDNAILTATYTSFKRNKPSSKRKWPPEDVYDLYTAIRSYGPDFSLIETFFKDRYTRKEIRLKFKRELRDNEKLMDLALYGGGGGGGGNTMTQLDIPLAVTTNKKNDDDNDASDKEQNNDKIDNAQENKEQEVIVEEDDDEQPPKRQEPLSLEEKYGNLFDDEEQNNMTQDNNADNNQEENTNENTNTSIVDDNDFDNSYIDDYHSVATGGTDTHSQAEFSQASANTSLSILGGSSIKKKKKKNKFKIKKKK